MPKIRAPLFSVSASGSIGGVITYRATTRGADAQRTPIPTGAASAGQRHYREKIKGAALAWRTIAPIDRIAWQQYAITTGQNSWIAFSREYSLQHVTAPALPLVPAAPFA